MMEALPQIASRDNQYLKLARSLKNKKARLDSGCFLLEGLRLAEEAVKASWPLKYGLVSEETLAQPRLQKLIQDLQAQGCPLYQLPDNMLQQAAATEHSQGLLLVAHLPLSGPQLPPQASFCVLADHMADPGNLGAIMRTAWAAGAEALLLSPGCADPYGPKTARASMGALLRLPIMAFEKDEDILALLRKKELQLYASSAQGTCCYNQADLRQPLVWLLGAEAEGLSNFWQQAADSSVYIPMAKGAESLNVAAAAAILLYETAAQRGFPADDKNRLAPEQKR